MGQTDPSMKRLGVILTVFVFVFCFNLLMFVFLEYEEPYTTGYTGSDKSNIITANIMNDLVTVLDADELCQEVENETVCDPISSFGFFNKYQWYLTMYAWKIYKTTPTVVDALEFAETDTGGTVLNFMSFFVGGYLITTAPDVEAWINVFVIPIYIFTLIVFWYLVVDYLKDITIVGSHL